MASGDNRVWIERRMENGLWVTAAKAVSAKDETLRYEFVAEKNSAGNNRSHTRQTGKISLQSGAEQTLAVLRTEGPQADHHVVSVRLYSGKELVAQAIAEY